MVARMSRKETGAYGPRGQSTRGPEPSPEPEHPPGFVPSQHLLPAPIVYGTTYGMHKTTLYLPDELKRALERAATARGCSEATLVREAVRKLATETEGPRPRLPLFKSRHPRLAEQVDEALKGFGER